MERSTPSAVILATNTRLLLHATRASHPCTVLAQSLGATEDRPPAWKTIETQLRRHAFANLPEHIATQVCSASVPLSKSTAVCRMPFFSLKAVQLHVKALKQGREVPRVCTELVVILLQRLQLLQIENGEGGGGCSWE